MSADNYGSIEKAISGDYEFSIGEVISEAWARTRGSKWTIHLAFLYAFLVMMGLMIAFAFLSTLLIEVTQAPSGNVALSLIMQLGLNLIMLPMMAGIMILGIKRSVDAPIRAGSVFDYFSKMIPLLLTMILMSIMIIIGFMLLILPGIYLSVAYYMAIPLMAEKGMSPWQALETSRKAITRRWFSVFAFFIILSIMVFISAIPLGLGLIWTMPLMIIAFGILYRNMFGVKAKTVTA